MAYKALVALALTGLAAPGFAHDGAREPVQAHRGPAQAAAPLHGAKPAAPPGSPHPATVFPPAQPHPTGAAPSPMLGAPGMARFDHRFSGGQRVFESTKAVPGGGTMRAIRYGQGLTGVVEHPMMKSGYSSRTYVRGGRVLYARVYRQHTYQRFGHSFAYESLVPAIGFSTAYYAWAARPWSTPVNYHWQWDREPWHRAYGNDFTPYSNYNSLDEWLTDYVVSQNLRNAYDNWQAESAPAAQAPVKQYPPVEGPRPYWEAQDDRRPYWEEQPADNDPSADADRPADKGQPVQSKAIRKSDPSSKAHGAGGSSTPPVPKSTAPKSSAPASTGSQPVASAGVAADAPPVLPGQVKAELNAQIKRQLAERQSPPTAQTQDLPDSLKPGHTLFRVNTPLDVPAKVSGTLCSLRANDYIERTGDLDQNGMVPVKVRVGAATDCAIGLSTQVAFNDLESMESEQQQALTDALVAASRNMGAGHALPQAPSTTPVLLAAGQTQPTPDATRTLGQLQ